MQRLCQDIWNVCMSCKRPVIYRCCPKSCLKAAPVAVSHRYGNRASWLGQSQMQRKGWRGVCLRCH